MTRATTKARERGNGERAFLVTALAVHAGNYAFNVLLGRQLGPAAFAELNLVVTFLLVLTVATHTIQLAAARATAQLDVGAGSHDVSVLNDWLRGRARTTGIALGGLLVLGAPALQQLFTSPSPWPYVLFGLGLPALVVLGADRGRLQGQLSFRRLAVTNVVEMAVRLAGGLALVAIGLGVEGAVVAITLSFVVAQRVARPPHPGAADQRADLVRVRNAVPLLLGPSFALLVGQVLIANGDVLVVKASQAPGAAGRYAVLALLGRVVFYATATLVEVGFPLAARRFHAGGDARTVLRLSLAATATLGLGAMGVLRLWGADLIGLAFGEQYVEIAPLAWRYTLATSLFSLAYVLASDALAKGRSRPTGLLVAGGVVQLAAVVVHRADLAAVVDAQVVAMACLALTTAVVVHRRAAAPSTRPVPVPAPAVA